MIPFFITLAAVIVILTGAYLFMILPCMKKHKNSHVFKNTLYAHRGLHDKSIGVPENTMAAFKRAVDAGFGIELDVHLCADGSTVITHDNSLKRMCGADIKVSLSNYADFKDIKILDTNETTPLFSEFLKLVDGRVPLLVELKTDDNNADSLCRAVFEHLDCYTGAYCVESFDPRVLGWLKKTVPMFTAVSFPAT